MVRPSKAASALLRGKASGSDEKSRKELEDYLKRALSERVRDLLDGDPTHRLTREELTDRLGDRVKQARVTRILRGEARVTLPLVVELANAFGMQPDEFLGPMLLAPEDVELRREQARKELYRDLEEARRVLAERYRANLERPEVERILAPAVKLLSQLSDAELGTAELLLYGLAEFWSRKDADRARDEALQLYRARLGMTQDQEETNAPQT